MKTSVHDFPRKQRPTGNIQVVWVEEVICGKRHGSQVDVTRARAHRHLCIQAHGLVAARNGIFFAQEQRM